MGNCLPCLAHEPRSHKSRSRGGSIFPIDQVKEPEKGVVRVKMVMTKEEAAQLLSKLAGSKETAMAYITNEFERNRRRCRISEALGLGRDPWRPALESIPES